MPEHDKIMLMKLFDAIIATSNLYKRQLRSLEAAIQTLQANVTQLKEQI